MSAKPKITEPPINGQSRISTDDAKAAIEAERKHRTEACGKELQAVLDKYRCALDVAMLIRGPGPDGIIPQVSIVAKE